jgi:hypothetical protein
MPLVPIDPQLTQHFNRSIMRLLRPSHLRDESYVTDFYCGVIEHPSGDPQFWPLLDLPDTETVPVHLEADGAELAQMLDVFVANEGLTKQEAGGLKATIPLLRGQAVRIADVIPASWQPYIMTRQQAEAAGYLRSE